MTACVFCRILSGELPSSRVYEDEFTVAFLDIHPIGEGHTLIIPKQHVESLTELSADQLMRIAQVGQLVAKHLKSEMVGCEGVTLSLADGVAAGQEVPHVHLHVIPRHGKDGFGWKFPAGYGAAMQREKLDTVARLVAQSIGRCGSPA